MFNTWPVINHKQNYLSTALRSDSILFGAIKTNYGFLKARDEGTNKINWLAVHMLVCYIIKM